MANTMMNTSSRVENPFRILTIKAATFGVYFCIASPMPSGKSRPNTSIAMRAYGTPMLAFLNTTWPREKSHMGMKAVGK